MGAIYELKTVFGSDFRNIAHEFPPDLRRRIHLNSDPEWLLNRYQQDPSQLCAFLLIDPEHIVGYAPFAIQDQPLVFRGGERKLASVHLNCVRFLGPPVWPRNSEAYELLSHALRAMDRIAAAFFEEIRVEDALLTHFRSDRAFTSYEIGGSREHHRICLPPTLAEYLSKFSSKSRSTLQRKAKKFAEALGEEPGLVCTSSAEQVHEFLAQAQQVSRQSYQWHLLGKGLRDIEALRRDFIFAAEHGWLRSYLLLAKAQPCAFMICYQREGTCYYIDVGYDQAWADYSPGTVLQYKVLTDLYARSTPQVFDFSTGGGEHKRFFGNSISYDRDVYLLRPSVKNSALVWLHRAGVTSSRVLVRLLERAGIKARLKQLIRRSSVKHTM